MIEQLGSMPFSREYLAEDTVGRWVIEKDPDSEPRMYVDDVMLGLIGLEKQTDPEETFRAWLAGIDANYMDSVLETEKMNTNGIRAEVQYPWHYPDGHTILIRCEGIRNYDYNNGIRTEGRHRDITNLVRLQKESAVISALSADFESVAYVILKDRKEMDVTISFRTSDRIKAMIPDWDQEVSFHNRLEMLIDVVGYEGDIKEFYAQTRREVILHHLQKETAYYVNARAVVEENVIEYFQMKFTADRDSDGSIIGLIVGIHTVDEEMRAELELREKVERLVDEKTEELKVKNKALSNVNERIIALVGEIVESRDEISGGHINRVKYLTQILGLQVMKDLPEYKLTVEDVYAMAEVSPLHDVGKIKVPDSILMKPGALTKEEFEIMKTHCEKGCEILNRMAGSWSDELVGLSMDICRYHHEKWDGNGYPYGLKGDDIPISAQIVSIADAYDALVSERCYKEAYSHEEAYEMIMNGECGMYSDKLLSCLTKCRDKFSESAIYSEAAAEEMNSDAPALYISDAMALIEKVSESMPGGFFVYQADKEEKLLYFNNLMVEYFGCSSREDFVNYIGNSFKGIVHPEDYMETEEEIEKQIGLADNSIDHVVYRIIRKDGEVRWLDDYGKYIQSSDIGNVFFVFVTDLTETINHRNDGISQPLRDDSLPADIGKGALNNLNILVVDDSEMTRSLHKELLEDEGAIVDEAVNGQEAVEIIKNNMDYDLVLMDIVMPVMNGVSATREITRLANEAGRHITIICLTAEGADMQVKEVLEAGAYDCLYKPLSVSELSGLVISSIKEKNLDIEKKLEDALVAANTDPLTKVRNIAAYTDRISELSAEIMEDDEFEFGIVLCDCDNLKTVNDSYGHEVGDRYIQNTSSVIREVFKESPVYRVGGDEFVVILQGEDYENVDTLIEQLGRMSDGSNSVADIESGKACFSYGLAIFNRSSDETVGDVIKRADMEMYSNKKEK